MKYLLNTLGCLLPGLLLFIQSCRCSCHCDKEMGCKLVVVKLTSNNKLLVSKQYCSQTNFLLEPALGDSVNAFAKRYQSDSTQIFVTDSVYYQESVTKLKCNETDAYSKKNYFCICAK